MFAVRWNTKPVPRAHVPRYYCAELFPSSVPIWLDEYFDYVNCSDCYDLIDLIECNIAPTKTSPEDASTIAQVPHVHFCTLFAPPAIAGVRWHTKADATDEFEDEFDLKSNFYE